MNITVEKDMNGTRVQARPVYKGGTAPAYWAAIVNNRMLSRTFETADALFKYAARALS